MTAQPWPDPARPGVPRDAEKDGWHWLKPKRGALFIARWVAASQKWNSEGTDIEPERFVPTYEYHGPVAPPGTEDHDWRRLLDHMLCDTAHALGCKPDSEAILAEIHDLQRRAAKNQRDPLKLATIVGRVGAALGLSPNADAEDYLLAISAIIKPAAPTTQPAAEQQRIWGREYDQFLIDVANVLGCEPERHAIMDRLHAKCENSLAEWAKNTKPAIDPVKQIERVCATQSATGIELPTWEDTQIKSLTQWTSLDEFISRYQPHPCNAAWRADLQSALNHAYAQGQQAGREEAAKIFDAEADLLREHIRQYSTPPFSPHYNCQEIINRKTDQLEIAQRHAAAIRALPATPEDRG